MKYWIALSAALTLNAAANLLMKAGMKSIGTREGGLLHGGITGAISAVLSSPILVAGLCCFGLNAAFYMYALQTHTLPISIAYPVMVGGGYALIALVAHWHPFLGESLASGQKLGVALVLAGIVLIAMQSPRNTP